MQFSLTFPDIVVTFIQTDDFCTTTGKGMLFLRDTSDISDGLPKVITKSCSFQQAAGIACLSLLGDDVNFSAASLYALTDGVVDDVPLNLRPIP